MTNTMMTIISFHRCTVYIASLEQSVLFIRYYYSKLMLKSQKPSIICVGSTVFRHSPPSLHQNIFRNTLSMTGPYPTPDMPPPRAKKTRTMKITKAPLTNQTTISISFVQTPSSESLPFAGSPPLPRAPTYGSMHRSAPAMRQTRAQPS